MFELTSKTFKTHKIISPVVSFWVIAVVYRTVKVTEKGTLIPSSYIFFIGDIEKILSRFMRSEKCMVFMCRQRGNNFGQFFHASVAITILFGLNHPRNKTDIFQQDMIIFILTFMFFYFICLFILHNYDVPNMLLLYFFNS